MEWFWIFLRHGLVTSGGFYLPDRIIQPLQIKVKLIHPSSLASDLFTITPQKKLPKIR